MFGKNPKFREESKELPFSDKFGLCGLATPCRSVCACSRSPSCRSKRTL